MKVNVTSSKGLESNLNVVVTKKEIQEKINDRLDEVKDNINIKGFRPGKAPKGLLLKQFGKALYGEVFEKTINESVQQALKEKKIKPASQPKIDIKSSGEDSDLEFTINVEKVPEIKKIQLDKIQLEKLQVIPDKKDLDTRLNQLAESSKKYNDKDLKEPAVKDDLVEFSFEATIDGKPFEGNKGEKLQIVLGKDLFIKGFDKQILGSKKNEEKIAIVNLPDNYPKKELAGKKTKFKCKILNIKKPSEQKIDDAFAKNMGAKDLKDLESMIEKQISREFENITNQLLNKEILDILDKEYKLDLPKGMLENEMKSVEHTLIHEKMREIGEKDHSKIKLDEKDKKELKKISERRVKLALVLTHIADENSIKVSPQELQTELEKQLKMYPGQEKTIKEYYQKNPGELTKLKGPLFEEKVINFIKDKAKLKIKQIKKEDLEKLMKQDQPIKAKEMKKVKSSSKTKKASSAKKSRKK
jgi:trigger factor